jgi:hypothetical protein
MKPNMQSDLSKISLTLRMPTFKIALSNNVISPGHALDTG